LANIYNFKREEHSSKGITHIYSTIKRGTPKNMIFKWTYFCLILCLQGTYLLILINYLITYFLSFLLTYLLAYLFTYLLYLLTYFN